jgi:CDP-2,3-bis-(O-geranylgeranyl)-sn-glycerol synthase
MDLPVLTDAEIRTALYLILASYTTNAVPLLLGGGAPLDGDRKFVDGRRILGENKTIRGFFAGFLVGLAVSIVLAMTVGSWVFGFGMLASFGTLIGDLGGAFLKRRLGIPAGGMLPIVDQLDFVAGALMFVMVAYTVPFMSVLLLVIVTPPIHLATNAAAYFLGLKKTYW